MQLVVLGLLGCCVIAHSASLSDALSDSRKEYEQISGQLLEALEGEELPSDVEVYLEDTTRVKRSGGGGSGGFLAGIGSAILGKVAEASSGASSASSSGRGHHYDSGEYPVHGYDDPNYDVWSFKKAILNTLFQALKAIGGGVIALKGKLIKGGGIIVSTKGSIISAKGEALTSLGRQIAASAVLSPPKHSQGYVYEPPVHVPSGHDSYGGPPPGPYNPHGGYAAGPASDGYGHNAYASPSDDADHPGLVILKRLTSKPEENHHASYEHFHDDSSASSRHPAVGPQHPALTILANAIGAKLQQKSEIGIGNFISKIAGASNGHSPRKVNVPSSAGGNWAVSHPVERVEHKENHQSSTYGPQVFETGNEYENHHDTRVSHNDQIQNGGVIQSDGQKVDSPLSSQEQNNFHYQNQSPLDSLASFHSPTNNNFGNLAAGTDFGQFSKPLEVPVLNGQNQQTFFSPQNQLQDFQLPHSSYGAFGRNSSPKNINDVKIVPSIGYDLNGPRVYRI